ncbi:uncharacterized protein LOC127750882 [Frankliniella occidentalis]|uniref:Uncharacterized protein LOC127750882 n=1 Tax=Frankliniella occidentalis TaxID=133901 RepID=A0A9C6XSY7_FRAOC|nr:uncharacterized protein LOC127750882 [Frankliniella occidentalis]
MYDSFEEDDGAGDEDSRVIVFGTRRNLEILFKCIMWFLDGTLKTAPHIFMQIFTILGLVVRSGADAEDPDTAVALPLVFALLPSKMEVHYTLVLQKVREAAERFRIRATSGPTKIMTDFELGIINAARAVFPEAVIRLCFFHLGQSSYRKVQHIGLQEQYNDPEDRSIKNAVHSLLALAFLPADRVLDAFDGLERVSPPSHRPFVPVLRGDLPACEVEQLRGDARRRAPHQ